MRALRLCGVLFAASLCAQESDPILVRLSAETANVVVVRDPLPVLEQLLASPVVAKLLEDTAPLQRRTIGRVFDAATLQRQLALVAPMIPIEIVIAAPTRTLDRLSHAAPLFACCTVLQIMARAKVDDAEKLSPIRSAARQHLEQLDGMPLQAWVRARDERTAEGWFDALAEALPARAKELGLEATVTGERIVLRGEPLAPGTGARRALDGAGVDTTTAPVVSVDAMIEQRGAVIELNVGRLAPPPCAAARLGQSWTNDRDVLLFARSEVGDGAAYLTGAYDAIAALGGVELAAGDTALMLRLVEFLQRVDAVTEDQTATLRVARGLELTLETPCDAGANAGEAVPAVLLRLAAADEPSFVTVDTLDVVLASWLSWIVGGVIPAGARGEPLEQFLDDEASAVFAPGVAVIARSAAMRGRKGRPEPLPFAALALVARPKSAEDAAGFMQQATAHVATMVRGSADGVWREQDLGLPVRAQVLQLDHVWPAHAEHQMDWDFVPHWFVAHGLLVVSTDPALSKELLARAGAASAAAEPGTVVHERLALRGASIHDAMTGALRWSPLLAELAPEQTERSVETWQACRAAASVVEAIELGAQTRGGVRRDRFTLRLREPAPK